MRWTRQRRARTGSQGGSSLVSDRRARKTNGAEADGEVVWSWHPLLVSSRRRSWRPNRAREDHSIREATVARGIRRRGERAISR